MFLLNFICYLDIVTAIKFCVYQGTEGMYLIKYFIERYPKDTAQKYWTHC